MGLIKAAIGALSGTLADTWKEAINCPVLGSDLIIANGVKMHSDSNRTSNTKGSDNVISNGSAIMVEENTCMLTIDNGKITNVVTEPGRYILDNSTAPSIFAGQIKDSAKDLISRFTFGGTPSVQQKVIYINLQRLPGIPFGTGSAVPYFDPVYNTSINLRFYGTFEVQIPDAENAVRFYTQVASKGISASSMSVKDVFKNEQYKNEFMQALNEAMNSLSDQGVSYDRLSSSSSKLTAAAKESVANIWSERGIVLTNIGLNAPTIDDESKEIIAERRRANTMLNADVQRAVMTGSVARGVEAAASNENGSMMGFMGMNMAMNAGGNILGQMGPAPQQTPPTAPTAPANGWNCSCGATGNAGAFCASCGAKKPEPWTCSCGTQNMGKFCANCGKSKEGAAPAAPTATEWECSCGTKNKGKFCANCGSAKPAAPKKYKCDKCGWTPEDPENPPKFCPECGDPFNEDDIV